MPVAEPQKAQGQARHVVIIATVFQSFLVLKASYLISTTSLMKL